jgi:hypothetical protein
VGRTYRVRRPSPALVLSMVALFGSDPGAATVSPLSDGSIQVSTAGNQKVSPDRTNGEFDKRTDQPFLVVVF